MAVEVDERGVEAEQRCLVRVRVTRLTLRNPNPNPNPNLELGKVPQAQRILGGALVELVRRGARRGGSAARLQLGPALHEGAVAPVERHVELATLVALADGMRPQAAHLARVRARVRVDEGAGAGAGAGAAEAEAEG